MSVQPGERRRLYRRATDRVFLGVCGGLGDYLGIDPVVIRLVFVVVSLAGGAGVLAYVVMAVLMPVEPEAPVDRPAGKTESAETLGVLLVGAGVVFLAGTLGWLAWVDWHYFWPILLIAVGVLVLVRHEPATHSTA